MKIARACSILALAVAATASVQAQNNSPAPILLGPFVGVDLALESGRIPVYAFSADCGEFTSGMANIVTAGAILTYSSLFAPRLGLSLAGSVSSSTGIFTTAPTGPTSIVEQGVLIQLEREYRLRHKALRFTADLLGTFRPLTHLELAAGLSVGYQPAISFSQTDNITGPDNYSFPDGQSSHTMLDGKKLSSSLVQFGPRIRVAYRLPVGPRLWLQPALTAHMDLASVVREARWQRFGAGAAIAVLFDLTPEQPAMPQPHAVEEKSKPVPLLKAAIELYGIDDHDQRRPVATVKVDEILYRQHTPLLPIIYFDQAALELPTRYQGLPVAGTDTLKLEKLAAKSIVEMQHYTLDVIGWRLRADTNAHITLIGSTSQDEAAALARGRAETVRSYLERTWGIGHERMTINDGNGNLQHSNEATEDGRADNRRVEIIASVPEITSSLVTEQIVRNFNPPVIRILPSFESEAGVRNWAVTISQETNIIARYSNRDDQTMDDSEFTWSIIHSKIDSALAPLVAELVVEDSAGTKARALTYIPLELEKQLRVVDGAVEHQGNHEQIGHTLVAFNYNSAELKASHEATLDQVARQVHDSAQITIVGYTDRIGDERYNAGLSTQRAEQVASALRARLQRRGIQGVRIKANGAGMETERFTNHLPEGRTLSRGVSIIIEQKIVADAPGQ